VRYIVRPVSIRRTPTLLARALSTQTRRYPGRTRFDWRQDLFLVYPPPPQVANSDDTYLELWGYFSSDKYNQKRMLADKGIPVPEHYQIRPEPIEGQWIVRPLRHYGGHNYRVTEDVTDFIPGIEYIQRVFPKTAEYRAVYVRGALTLLLKKRNFGGVPPELPWNHTNGSSFYTIQHPEETKLATRTDCLAVLPGLPIIRCAHVVAVDILYHDILGYVIAEVNTCPGITIPSNLERVCNVLRSAC
jgi:hypothetical protein